jgi:hypothetical protein
MIKEFLHPILQVFTKEYREETEYQIFMEKHKDMFRLNDNAEPIDNIIDRLKKKNFQSNFTVTINYS